MSNPKSIICIIDDDRNSELAPNFANSLKKFHTEQDLEIKIVRRDDEQEWITDPAFYYRAKALIADKYIDDYDLVIVADADNICLGNLDYILNTDDYDVGTVLNWNRTDPKTYGLVTVFNINPMEYYNAGFIAFRSKRFVKHFKRMCFSRYFQHKSMRYREQDILNIITHYGDYKVRCFDKEDVINGYNAWHGLIAKGEGMRMILHKGQVLLPPDNTGYPNKIKIIKLYHYAGGNNERKNHRLYFNEDMVKHIDRLISDE